MHDLHKILAVVRLVVAIALGALFIKVAPTLASHAAGHASTYAAPAAAGARH